MSREKKIAEYEARNARLKQVEENIKRGPEGKFYGADFQLGFEFIFGEIVQLQREFNERFGTDMPSDPRFTEFYDRMIQILESSEGVLSGSIVGPARAKLQEGQAEITST
jgi:hypothetical protein